MRYGIPIFGDRIAPRCTIADAVLLVTQNGGRITEQAAVPLEGSTWAELLTVLGRHRVDTLVCGGIDRNTKSLVQSKNLSVIENVACTIDAVIHAIRHGSLRPGFGFSGEVPEQADRGADLGPDRIGGQGSGARRPLSEVTGPRLNGFDCLSCRERVCLRGEPCGPWLSAREDDDLDNARLMLESTMDIALESERTLCRLSEIIYFCLEMEYRKLGVAYCLDLEEPAQILVGLLRRFFDVIPVCCKIGGNRVAESYDTGSRRAPSENVDHISCNPRGQAEILNELDTDLNIAVGLCMGADCVFARASRAPATTFVVKDKSLAHNPIGALYSDYYLKEAARASIDGI